MYKHQDVRLITVLSPDENRGTMTLWECRCNKCGERFLARQRLLESEAIRECPKCLNKEADFNIEISDDDMFCSSFSNKQFITMKKVEFFEIKARINESLVLVNCGCGKRLAIPLIDLIERRYSSCGCYDPIFDDLDVPKSVLENRQVGELTVLKATNIYRPHGKNRKCQFWRYFRCRCSCGNEFLMIRGSLQSAIDAKCSSDCGCGIGKHPQWKSKKKTSNKEGCA